MVTEDGGSFRLAFPDAEYVVQRGEWEDAYSGKSDSYQTEVFDVLQRSGNLLLVEGDGTLNTEISYEVSGGHTPHHQVFHIRVGGEQIHRHNARPERNRTATMIFFIRRHPLADIRRFLWVRDVRSRYW